MRRAFLAFVLGLATAVAAGAAGIPTPESVLGFAPGTDPAPADWRHMVAYFDALDAASPRLSVENVGPTTDGQPFLGVTISSEAKRAPLEGVPRRNPPP